MCLLGNNDDLTDVVERDSEYHIGIGEHSDLWRGNLEVDGVPTLAAIKVLRGGSGSRPDSQEQLIKELRQGTSEFNSIKTVGIYRRTSPEIMDPPNNFSHEDDHPESSYSGQSQNVQMFSMARDVSLRNSEINNVGGALTINNYNFYLQPDSKPVQVSTWDLWTQPLLDLKLKMVHAAERVKKYLAHFK